MFYDVKMRVWSGPRAFDDVTVRVDAVGGDDAAAKASQKAGSKKHIVHEIMPSVDQAKAKKAK